MMEAIKVGFCVAYDWYLLEYALPLIYADATVIGLSIDQDRISWSGNSYPFDEAGFKALITKLDPEKKIRVFEENYHLPDLTPMQNEVRQRNLMAKHLGEGGWFVQLDCDEYFLNFSGFVRYLRSLPFQLTRRANICCPWIILYKQTDEGFLYVDPLEAARTEFMQIATREPGYEYGRRNGNFNLYVNFSILHQSWARSRAEIQEKINNWGHSDHFDKEKYFSFWDKLNASNFNEARDIHPIKPREWPRLKYVKGRSIPELLKNFPLAAMPAYSRSKLFFKNSRFFSKVRSLFK
ncbi:hypothetical protein SAMN04488109_2255 [Chryseolinea serpens]|uniref:Glycosyl transferase family 2 n=1 Tax=Chryseolinea serpens TaxID=947013 RepID=A0A1M5NDS2_9BACT|nr:hypothetical protein [Chryseolinea serpens]SHG87339.1 hypothetical protein SAMN04488109_2255 [Chryseolinea serpens]